MVLIINTMTSEDSCLIYSSSCKLQLSVETPVFTNATHSYLQEDLTKQVPWFIRTAAVFEISCQWNSTAIL